MSALISIAVAIMCLLGKLKFIVVWISFRFCLFSLFSFHNLVFGTKRSIYFKIYLISKLQKSVADLKKLHIERSGANLTLPSPHHGHEKVLIHTCSYIFKKYFMLVFMFKFLHCLLIYPYRFWRDSCLWINFVKSNSTVF